jgi:hypothetical protein
MNIFNDVKNEVLSCFSEDEIKVKSWNDFWNEIDVLNAYEEAWNDCKNEGIQKTYKKVFEDIKNS